MPTLSEIVAFCDKRTRRAEVKDFPGSYNGLQVENNGEVTKIEPMHAAKVIDTTGAGDLWAAGFLHGWSHQLDHAQSAKIGSILGAAVVQVQGSVLPAHVWDDVMSAIQA